MRVRVCIVMVMLVLATAATAQVAPASAPSQSVRATSSIRAAPVRSSYETSTRALSRDIGVSVPLPDGHVLWLFGDTSVYTTNAAGAWVNTGFVDGSTALLGKYARGQVPHGGEYPAKSPRRFIPVPKNVYLPDGSRRPCVKSTGNAAFAARWPTGAVVLASNTSEVLVTYVEVCVTVPSVNTPVVQAEGWGYLLFDWRARRIALGPIDVFRPHAIGDELAPSHVFGWPMYVNGKLTMFSSSCTAKYLTCGGGHVWSVTTAKLGDPKSYHLTPMTTDGSAQWEPLSISVGQYLSGLRLIEVTTIGGDYKLFGASKLGAPWHVIHSGTLPDCAPTTTNYCHGVEGHPELSTLTDIFISYKDPNSGPGGHMVISALPD